MLDKKLIEHCLVKPGKRFRLKDHDTAWAGGKDLRRLGKDELKHKAKEFLDRNIEKLAEAQELLYASDRWSILVILQAMDAAGKDGIIKHVMSGLNPQGCQVHSFKAPSAEELDHTFLWRCMLRLPARGHIGIFNRSYYEETLVVRVHPEILEKEKLPPGKRGDKFWRDRYDDINNLERHLVRNGTLVLKFFLNVSKKEQRKRFLERLENPDKRWKFSASDMAERAYWKDYMRAFEETIGATSTEWAPWYVIPADNKWVSRALVGEILTTTIRSLDLHFPEVPPDRLKDLEKAKRELADE